MFDQNLVQNDIIFLYGGSIVLVAVCTQALFSYWNMRDSVEMRPQTVSHDG